MMRELSLFSGAGGGLLGTMLLGWRPVGYVEWDDYCQRVLRARIDDGYLPDAPIFGDIRAFISDGYAASYTGMVDVITAGFPCQPFSTAGKRAGADDPRNMWPATIDVIRVVRPRYCLLENVPGLLSSGYFGTILGDLVESGYDARWRVLSAAEVGAPHKRDRLWIVADAEGYLWRASGDERQPPSHRASPAFPDAEEHGRGPRRAGRLAAGGAGQRQPERALANSEGESAGGLPLREEQAEPQSGIRSEDVAYTSCERRQEQRRTVTDEARHAKSECGGWWTTEPALGLVAHGVANPVDQLRALGNGQVPAVVAAAWRLLTKAGVAEELCDWLLDDDSVEVSK